MGGVVAGCFGSGPHWDDLRPALRLHKPLPTTLTLTRTGTCARKDRPQRGRTKLQVTDVLLCETPLPTIPLNALASCLIFKFSLSLSLSLFNCTFSLCFTSSFGAVRDWRGEFWTFRGLRPKQLDPPVTIQSSWRRHSQPGGQRPVKTTATAVAFFAERVLVLCQSFFLHLELG